MPRRRELPRNAWTPIAERARDCERDDTLFWEPLPRAPLSIEDAHHLVAADALVMANRHSDDRVELVVRPVSQSAAAKAAA